jgi:arsenite-transporting ATPase
LSTDPAHSTGDILEAKLGPEPREVTRDLWAMEIDPALEADRYISDVKERIAATTPPRLMAEVERQIDIARVTPGAEEAALFERFTRIVEDGGADFDRILFDTAPLGHTLRLLSLPEQMAAWMNGLISRRRKVNVLRRMWKTVAGTVARAGQDPPDPVLATLEERLARFKRARAVLSDARRTAFVFVLVPERLPVLETERAVRTLDRCGIPVGAIVVNRVLPDDAEGRFFERRRVTQAEPLDMIDERFSAYPVYRVPLFESDVVGREALRRATAALPEYERSSAVRLPRRQRLP